MNSENTIKRHFNMIMAIFVNSMHRPITQFTPIRSSISSWPIRVSTPLVADTVYTPVLRHFMRGSKNIAGMLKTVRIQHAHTISMHGSTNTIATHARLHICTSISASNRIRGGPDHLNQLCGRSRVSKSRPTGHHGMPQPKFCAMPNLGERQE